MSNRLGILTDIYYKSYIGSTKVHNQCLMIIQIYDMEVSREKRNQEMDWYMSQIATHSTFGRDIFELTESSVRKEAVELQAVRMQREKLHSIYTQILPKAVPGLIGDLLSREGYYHESHEDAPMYTIEVFTKKGTDPEEAKRYIFEKTGMMPAVYDKDTHYVTNQKLTLQILKEISDCKDVLEITGEYSGSCGSNGPVHERGDQAHCRLL